MAQFQAFDLTNVRGSALGASDALYCLHIQGLTIQTSGSGVWALDIEATNDGTNWVKTNVGVISGQLFTLNAAVTHVRANTTSFSSGAPAVRISGWSSS